MVVVVASIGLRVHAEDRPIDVAHSTLTVLVAKSGLFSAFADNHVIKAPILNGTLQEDAPGKVEVNVRAADLQVLDPGLSPSRRADVQARMLGPDVLDVAHFPDIAFASTTIEPSGTMRWQVTGRLTIHGRMRVITFPVVRQDAAYHGEVTIRQRDFGIEPISVAGGSVKVKDELRIRFDIVP